MPIFMRTAAPMLPRWWRRAARGTGGVQHQDVATKLMTEPRFLPLGVLACRGGDRRNRRSRGRRPCRTATASRTPMPSIPGPSIGAPSANAAATSSSRPRSSIAVVRARMRWWRRWRGAVSRTVHGVTTPCAFAAACHHDSGCPVRRAISIARAARCRPLPHDSRDRAARPSAPGWRCPSDRSHARVPRGRADRSTVRRRAHPPAHARRARCRQRPPGVCHAPGPSRSPSPPRAQSVRHCTVHRDAPRRPGGAGRDRVPCAWPSP